MSEDLLGSRTGVVSPARVTVDARATLVTPYLVRITGTYRCPAGTPGRLLVACVVAVARRGRRDTDGPMIAGGEVGQIDADGRTHAFTIDLGRPADADQGEDPNQYRSGEAARVVAKLYYDELADRLDWRRFVADFEAGRSAVPVGHEADRRPAATTNPGRRSRCRPVLATVHEIVVVG
ncbi:hypothetical protein ACFXPS_38065 [Nocardia sp. NPDC059091]|uniref:hypothetical protein n=1 Tax=unclassified Nocardia TaxID=2637762 RepID=UPI003678D60F